MRQRSAEEVVYLPAIRELRRRRMGENFVLARWLSLSPTPSCALSEMKRDIFPTLLFLFHEEGNQPRMK